MLLRYAVACAIILTTGLSFAQSPEPDDSWLTHNYHLTGPLPPPEAKPVDPVLSGLTQVQEKTLAILRKAYQDDDLQTALAAASQAAANMQLLGVVSGRLVPPGPPRQASAPVPQDPQPSDSRYLIAFQDHTVQAVTSYWTDALMFHYLTPQGAHEQVRMDLVDRARSIELNRQGKPGFRLPEPAALSAGSF